MPEWFLLINHDLNVYAFLLHAVVESKDGTISVASAFAGHQEGETIAVVIIIFVIPLSLHSFTY
jgi:hypothetical protein